MGKGRAPCCDKDKVNKGPWSDAEDLRLTAFIQEHGHTNWRALPKQAGLLRCGKSCRLRWINYLRPDVKRGNFTPQEEQTIINLHNSIGNKWSKIASHLPGRTDNEIKNVWNTHLKKRLTKKSAADNNGYKTNYSASPSCTSSSITSSGDPKMDKSLPNQAVQESADPNQKPEFHELKSTHPSNDHNDNDNDIPSDTPTSSSASNFSESSRGSRPDEASEFSKPEGGLEDGKIELLLESDIDFWELFNSLDDPLHNGGNQDSSSTLSNPDPGIEDSKWLRFLENELGLTNDHHVDMHLPKDKSIVQTSPAQVQYVEMHLEPEIGPGLDYFPIWPCSPQNLGI